MPPADTGARRSQAGGSPGGLRERKKLDAMYRIQTVALELFEARGFDVVTVEEIAAAAEFAPRTIYRYFGTKEMLVIWDHYDDDTLAAVITELSERHLIDALRRVVLVTIAAWDNAELERIRRRVRLVYVHPAIEAAAILFSYEVAREIATSWKETGHDEADAQMVVHALVGALLGAIRQWWLSDFSIPPGELIDRALTLVERGIGPAQGASREPTGGWLPQRVIDR